VETRSSDQDSAAAGEGTAEPAPASVSADESKIATTLAIAATTSATPHKFAKRRLDWPGPSSYEAIRFCVDELAVLQIMLSQKAFLLEAALFQQSSGLLAATVVFQVTTLAPTGPAMVATIAATDRRTVG
jgi:hypothetical protein